MARLIFFLFLGISLSTVGTPLHSMAQVNPNQINQSLIDESVEAVLGDGKPLEWYTVPIADSTKAKIREQLKAKATVVDTLYIGVVSTADGKQFVLPDIAPSRSEKFSYLLYFTSTRKITGIDVLEYRENYGYEIDHSYFKNQFMGENNPDKIIFGRSIQNISGATISARSITNSIHDLLLILNEIKLP